MAAQRHDRNKGRCTAMQLLYASEITGEDPLAIVKNGTAPEEVVVDDYALELIEGVSAHKAEIDELLSQVSENWSVDRMPVVDKCILRMAIYEMKYVDRVPVAVSVNEAVDLARNFGGEEESHRFVNGVLGKVALRLADEAQQAWARAHSAGDNDKTA